MPELLHLLFGQGLDGDAKRLQFGRPFGEFDGPKHIGRLVDQFARQNRALGHSQARRPGLLRLARLGGYDVERSRRLGRLAVVVVFSTLAALAALVTVEGIGAEDRPEADFSELIAGDRHAIRPLRDQRRLLALAQRAENGAAKTRPIAFHKLSRLAESNHDESVEAQPCRREHVQGRHRLTFIVGNACGF
jgi:hypothetical protein